MAALGFGRIFIAGLSIIDLDQIDLDKRTITFRPDQTKGKVEAPRVFHESLVAPLREWIEKIRGNPPHRFLWVTRSGGSRHR